MERCRQVIAAFGMPVYELEGFEADDLMGTLSTQAAAEGVDTYLVSMDSDIAQLVNDGVHMWMYRPYQRDSVIFKDAADVKERYGVLPSQVADLKALKGDTSDNIPGIPGVGDKTAIKLVDQFGSVENLLDHVDDVAPAKLQGLVRDNADQLRQSKRLATIVCDAPVHARPGGRRLLRALRPGARPGDLPRAGVPHARAALAGQRRRAGAAAA